MPTVSSNYSDTNFSDDSSVGTIVWSNPNLAAVQDSNEAHAANIPANGGITHYLKALGAVNVPSGVILDSIVLTVVHRAGNAGVIVDNAIKLIKGGVVQSIDKSSATTWAGTSETFTYTWSGTDLSGWSSTDINSANFGFVISAKNTDTANTRAANVDFAGITVTYHSVYNETGCSITGTGTLGETDGRLFTETSKTFTQTGLVSNVVIEVFSEQALIIAGTGTITESDNFIPFWLQTLLGTGNFVLIAQGNGAFALIPVGTGAFTRLV
jgi:hypothetical protein